MQITQPSRTSTENLLFSQRQNFQQPSSNSASFHDYQQISQDQSENYPFFQQNKNNIQQNKNRHQTAYYTPNYFSSVDEDYYQTDVFAPYTQEHHMRQPRPNLASQNNIFYSQNPASTQSHTPLQMQDPVHNLINQCRCKTLSVNVLINQRNCKIKSRHHITYSSMK